MKFYRRIGILLVIVLLIAPTLVLAGRRQEETRTFEGVEAIRINTVSGDCVVQKGSGDEVTVEVVWSYSPRDSFEPRFTDRGRVLKLSEDMYGSNSGSSLWTLTVPDGVEIRFNSASGGIRISELEGEFSAETASGDIEIDRCRGEFDFSSASGDVEMIECSGDFDLNTASGDIELRACQGDFETSTASGEIDADGVILDEASEFSTASGRAIVTLGATAEHDLRVSTASGRATLDYNGNPIKGYFEFTAKYRDGRIDAPFDFDDEEGYRRWGDRYVRKWFTKEADTPEIFIETASGHAVLTE